MTPEWLERRYDVQGFYWDPLLVTREEYRQERNVSMMQYQKTLQPKLKACLALKKVSRPCKQ